MNHGKCLQFHKICTTIEITLLNYALNRMCLAIYVRVYRYAHRGLYEL